MIVTDHISESLETIFGVKNTENIWCGSRIFLTLDPGGWKISDPGWTSRIRNTDFLLAEDPESNPHFLHWNPDLRHIGTYPQYILITHRHTGTFPFHFNSLWWYSSTAGPDWREGLWPAAGKVTLAVIQLRKYVQHSTELPTRDGHRFSPHSREAISLEASILGAAAVSHKRPSLGTQLSIFQVHLLTDSRHSRVFISWQVV